MSSGGSERGDREGSLALTDEDRKRRDEILKGIEGNTTISQLTKQELTGELTDEALSRAIAEASEGLDFRNEAYKNARNKNTSIGGTGSRSPSKSQRRRAEEQLYSQFKTDLLDKKFKESNEEFGRAAEGLGSKYKSRQIQKTSGELTRDQPGILQTRIVK